VLEGEALVAPPDTASRASKRGVLSMDEDDEVVDRDQTRASGPAEQ
jgi:hypothetical protein